VRDLRGAAEAIHSGRMGSAGEVEAFSRALMKQTLFHEVGHALGLGHNFKGSLTFDRSKPDSLFSSSIMDYNDFEIERQAFDGADSANGPLLEYDRQALSAIYNQLKDVKESDPLMPVCTDVEADTEEYGVVDPMCMRYDIENDPTLAITTAMNRVNADAMEKDVSLSQALANAQKSILSDELIAAIDTKEKLAFVIRGLRANLYGVTRFYYLSGKASLTRAVKSNLKSLYIFEDDILPEGASELAMRTRALNGVKNVLSMDGLSENTRSALVSLGNESAKRLLQSPLLSALSPADTASVTVQIKMAIMSLANRFAQDTSAGLPKVRMAVLDGLTRTPTLPFFFGKAEGTAFDVENEAIELLANSAGSLGLAPIERLHAAKALSSYQGRPGVAERASRLKAQIETELSSATNNGQREFALRMKKLLAAL
jgi:hypothetical protein